MKLVSRVKGKTFLILFLIGSSAFILRWLPSFWAYLQKGKRVFLGINALVNLGDIWVYWADMMMGRQGNFLLLKEYGIDPQESFFIRLPYVYLGHLSRLFNLPVEIVYLMAAYLLSLALAFVLFHFSRLFFKKDSWQLLAVSLALLSGPLTPSLPAEAMPFLALIEPHFILAQIFLVLVFLFFLRSESSDTRKQKLKNIIYIVAAAMGLSLIHVFMNWVAVAILSAWLVVSFILWREKRNLIPLFWLVIASLPMTLYLFWLAKRSLFFQNWLDKNRLSLTPPLMLLLQLFFPLLFLFFFLKVFKTNRKALFLLVWLGVQFLFAFSPVDWRIRFNEGWWITCSFLAALGVFSLYQKWRSRGIILTLIIAPFLFISHFSLLLAEVEVIFKRQDLFSVSQAEAETWDFLLPRCDFSKIVFSNLPRSVYLPGKTGCRSALGHSHLTFDFLRRRVDLERINHGEISPVDLESFFQERGIDYVLLSQEEARIARLSEVNHLKLVFENEEFIIYQPVKETAF